MPTGGLEKHPGSGDMRKFIASTLTAYKAGCKFLVASVMESFKVGPQAPRTEKLHLNSPKGSRTNVHMPFNSPETSRLQCKVCFVSISRSSKGRCKQVEGKRHVISTAGPFTFCVLCGAHTRLPLCRLKSSCPITVNTGARGRALESWSKGLPQIWTHPA